MKMASWLLKHIGIDIKVIMPNFVENTWSFGSHPMEDEKNNRVSKDGNKVRSLTMCLSESNRKLVFEL